MKHEPLKPAYQDYKQIVVNGQVWVYWYDNAYRISWWADNDAVGHLLITGMMPEEIKEHLISKLSNEPITDQPRRKYLALISENHIHEELRRYIGYNPIEQAYMIYNSYCTAEVVQELDAYYKALEVSKELYGSDMDV